MADEKQLSEYSSVSDVAAGSYIYVIYPDVSSASGFSSAKIAASDFGETILNDFEWPLLLDTTAKSIIGAINELAFFTLSGTLAAGQTSITLTDNRITTTSHVFPWSSVWGLVPTSVTVAAGSVTLTFPAQQSNITVEARVS